MYPIMKKIYCEKKIEDIVILSAGHAGLCQYVILEELYGHDAESMLHDFGIHPCRDVTRGIHASSGSLGCGILIAVGIALCNPTIDVYCLISDGECAEGSVWEALAFCYKQDLKKLKIHVNINGYCAYDSIDREHLEKRLLAFCPWITIYQTVNPNIPPCHDLHGHYHVMSSEDYSSFKEYFNT